MDAVAMRMFALGLTGALVCGVSAWLCINGKDGSGWAIVAFCLFLSTCSQE